MIRLLCIILWSFLYVTGAEAKDFVLWKQDFIAEAKKEKISDATIKTFFENITFYPNIIELDTKQPENRLNFKDYLEIMLPESRIKEGQNRFFLNLPLLKDIEDKYGIPPHYLIAFWGLETNFGQNKGVFPLDSALYTLAVDSRRGDFFTKELINALKISQTNGIDIHKLKASWAGAFGHFQFMPSTYLKYAVDYDEDGKVDVVNSFPDALASAANYLKSVGWNKEQKWGRVVKLPQNIVRANGDLLSLKTITEWKRLGLTNAFDKALPDSDLKAELVLPMGYKGPAFLVYPNFYVIHDWNRSLFYALAVGYFADRLLHKSALKIQADVNYISSLSEAKKLQSELCKSGEYKGKIDGILGRKTREAIKTFQTKYNLIPDGYPDKNLLKRVRKQNKNKKEKNESFACEDM